MVLLGHKGANAKSPLEQEKVRRYLYTTYNIVSEKLFIKTYFTSTSRTQFPRKNILLYWVFSNLMSLFKGVIFESSLRKTLHMKV